MTEPTTHRPRRRWVMPLLAVSLAANLLVAGAVAGAFIKGKGDRGAEARGPSGVVYLKALERADRRDIFAQMRETNTRTRQARREIDLQILDLLKAEPFDATQLAGFFEDQMALGQTPKQRVQELWLTRVRAMSAEERASYVARIEDIIARRDAKRARPPSD